ncbi:hypothetical protein YK48G_09350 [Lentilactobacillus fungorum]|uniref:Uncharacterized protein n=1 Tax=Lentilactobacillus fungorum TaxID=2201250 RepID=A0ABQ3VX74_9LACO|nr:hypothetical protein YK48G_09350 [Lentilactobacillus fungorum]
MCRLLLGFARFGKVAQKRKSMGLGFLAGVTYVQTSAWFRTFQPSSQERKSMKIQLFTITELCTI